MTRSSSFKDDSTGTVQGGKSKGREKKRWEGNIIRMDMFRVGWTERKGEMWLPDNP